MKNLLKSALGGLVEFDPEPPATTPPANTSTAGVPVQASKAYGTSSPTPVSMINVDPGMIDILQKKINSRPTPYTALLDNAKNLEDVIPDENMRLKAAFKTVTKDGNRTVQSIAAAIDVHITDIDGERLRFKTQTDIQLQAKSGTMRSQVKALESENETGRRRLEELANEMASIQQRISENQEKITQLNVQADTAEAEIQNTAAEFNRAVDFIKGDLTNKKASLTATLAS